MSAQWVIPGWPETEEHFTCWLQERVQNAQGSGRVVEMLKGVHGNDDVCRLVCRKCEETSILNACRQRFLSSCFENIRTDINTSDPLSPFPGYFNGISPFAAAEVDDHFPCNLGKEVSAHQNLELRLAFVSAPATASRASWRDDL